MTYFGMKAMTAPMPNSSLALALDLLGQLWRWARRPAMVDRQKHELGQLSDYILKDIGLSRADIDDIALQVIDRRTDGPPRSRAR